MFFITFPQPGSFGVDIFFYLNIIINGEGGHNGFICFDDKINP